MNRASVFKLIKTFARDLVSVKRRDDRKMPETWA